VSLSGDAAGSRAWPGRSRRNGLDFDTRPRQDPSIAEPNIWSNDWESDDDWSGGGAETTRLPRGEQLGATLYQLAPGDSVIFHFHHAQEELLIVLRGTPTLRGPDGERQLREGEAIHFPTGPGGAHGIRNDTDGPTRHVMVSTQTLPEVAEYPDLKQVTAQSSKESQTGEPLWLIHDVE
jgi:uncharacterized cupin superfamily protein